MPGSWPSAVYHATPSPTRCCQTIGWSPMVPVTPSGGTGSSALGEVRGVGVRGVRRLVDAQQHAGARARAPRERVELLERHQPTLGQVGGGAVVGLLADDDAGL